MFDLRFQLRLIPLHTVTGVALCLALLGTGCGKKPARAVPPVLAPTIETQQQPAPETEAPANGSANSEPANPPANSSQQNAQKPKPKPRKPVAHKPPPAQPTITEAPKPEPPKPNAPDTSVQITADVPRAAVQSQKQNTEQLLRNSEGKIGQINRNLNDSEQGMLHQARNYISQANQALQSGDIERAYNLAVKANLLANELAK